MAATKKGLVSVQFSILWPEGRISGVPAMTEAEALEKAREILKEAGTAVGLVEKEDDGVYLIEVDQAFWKRLEQDGYWEGRKAVPGLGDVVLEAEAP